MYSHLLTILALATASPAAASSIENLSTIPIANPESVVEIRCGDCVGHETIEEPTYKVPELHGSTQRLELQDRNGKPALMRTEAFMGGSPVTFVSLNPVFIDSEKAPLPCAAVPRRRATAWICRRRPRRSAPEPRSIQHLSRPCLPMRRRRRISQASSCDQVTEIQQRQLN